MSPKKEAALGIAPKAANKSTSASIIHPKFARRQFFADSFGRFLTALVASAELAGHDRVVNDLLQFKARWIRGGRP